ncbi:MAG: hypothetical protein HY822_15480 [Acidobacteria bacterium]|nr:hypothetical protein [Acidobacteriota bacterium]
MAARSQTSSMKRQKELARQERQKEKVAKKAQRKLEKRPLEDEPLVLETPPPESQPD